MEINNSGPRGIFAKNCEKGILGRPFLQKYPEYMLKKPLDLSKKKIAESRKWDEFYKRSRRGPFTNMAGKKDYFSTNKELFFIGNFKIRC